MVEDLIDLNVLQVIGMNKAIELVSHGSNYFLFTVDKTFQFIDFTN